MCLCSKLGECHLHTKVLQVFGYDVLATGVSMITSSHTWSFCGICFPDLSVVVVLGWGRTPETASQEHKYSLLCDRCACEQIQGEAHVLLMYGDTDVFALRSGKVCLPIQSIQFSHMISKKSNLICDNKSVPRWFMISSCNLTTLFSFVSLLAGKDHSQANQPNSLAHVI
jgi:hypothetical protein